ncbi:MAG TPA: delta(1)-pyrroline-2-carboxylate reductase family protein [Planctomycetota bacterium]|nr:delta(1)-pyrroline-2-carboxylate reductase family protein [Planctomycetota bacterium]
MQSLDASRTAELLPWPALVDALRDMLRRRHRGLTASPERLVVPLSGGTLLAMPATDGEYASTKLVTVHEGNAARGLPVLLGEVLLMRADTGERLLMLDGPTVTARRTAAMSALAVLELAPSRRESLLIVGSGVQARAHLDAFTALLGVRRVRVCSRTPAHAQAFAEHALERGIDCAAVAEPGGALAEADLVVTGTTATEPLFADEPSFEGFVAAVGAFRPQMCELPAALVARASLFVDDLDGARHEAGDLIRAGVDWATVTPLERVVVGAAPRPARGPVVFKSVGQALWDLAACRLAWSRAAGAVER